MIKSNIQENCDSDNRATYVPHESELEVNTAGAMTIVAW